MFIIISKNWRYVSYSLEIANPRDPSIRDPLIHDPLNTDAHHIIKLMADTVKLALSL